MNDSHSICEKVRIGPEGFFESRTSSISPALATSTQAPDPLAVLFFHASEPYCCKLVTTAFPFSHPPDYPCWGSLLQPNESRAPRYSGKNERDQVVT